MFYKSINWLRGIAIIFVVLSHLNYDKYINNTSVKVFYQDGSFLFVFISGFLFYHLINRYEYADFMRKKFENVILPYLLVTAPIALLSCFFYTSGIEWFNQVPQFSNVIYLYFYQITTGGALLEPYWFVPMITIFFIISPLLVKIMNGKYFMLFMLIGMTYTLLSSSPGSVSPVLSMVHWFGVYMLGAFSCKYYNVLKANSLLVLCLTITGLVFYYLNERYTWVINSLHIQKLLITYLFISIFIILELRLNEIKTLEILAHYSFGIYFLHGYVNFISNMIIFRFFSEGYFGLILTFVLCLIVPCIIIKISYVILGKVKLNIKPRMLFGV
jgi:peptidoglycan/LPS O-acetylase OafA/YrhL